MTNKSFQISTKPLLASCSHGGHIPLKELKVTEVLNSIEPVENSKTKRETNNVPDNIKKPIADTVMPVNELLFVLNSMFYILILFIYFRVLMIQYLPLRKMEFTCLRWKLKIATNRYRILMPPFILK